MAAILETKLAYHILRLNGLWLRLLCTQISVYPPFVN